MLPAPILRRELRAAAPWRNVLALRIALALIFAVFALGPILALPVWWAGSGQWGSPVGHLRACVGITFVALAAMQCLISCVMVPRLVGGAIAEERERSTLDALLLTRLTCGQIALAKWAGRLSPALIPALVSWPFLAVAGLGMDLPVVILALVLAGAVTTAVTMAALSILGSARHPSAVAARGAAGGLILCWLLFLPIGSIIPPGWAGGWSGPVSAVRSACAVVAPSSPVSLATDSRWMSDRSGGWLRDRLLLMIGSQAAIAMLALFAAGQYVDPIEARAAWEAGADPGRGYRPPCRDDPIVWREYDLAVRKGVSKTLLWSRYLLGMLRYGFALLVSLLGAGVGIIRAVLVLVFPVGVIAGAAWFGYPALEERWRHGDAAGGPFQARDTLGYYLRWGMALMAGSCLLGVTVNATSRVLAEQAKGTWVLLLATPLSGAEILGSKMKATALGLRSTASWFVAFGVFGVICGAVHPLGCAFAIVDLGLALWAGIVLGIRAGVKPVMTPSGTLISTLGAPAFLLAHGSLALAATSSGRDLARLFSWDPRLRWVVLLLAVVVPAATGAIAWSSMRAMFRDFDECVGRPMRGRAPGAEASPPGPGETRPATPRAIIRAAE